MKTRYTGKSLEADLVKLNEKLKSAGHELQFVIGYRYNYTAVDLATAQQAERHCTQRMLEGGTPRKCLNACNAYVVEHI